ncbi:MAG: DUF4142 domain-containing protein [Anaeromyxobacteraceae bacterium]
MKIGRYWMSAGLAGALAVAGPAFAQSGTTGEAQGSQGASTRARSDGSSARSGKLDDDLTKAMEKLHAANQAEVQTGQLAATQASSQQVKDFAERMVKEHGKNDEQLQQLAQTMGVTLEGKEFQDAQKDKQDDAKKLQSKTGADFDKAYMSLMEKDHDKDMKELQKAAKKAHDKNHAELAAFFDETHKTVMGHHTMAKTLEKQTKDGHRTATGTSRSGTGTSGTGSGSMGDDGSKK